jgi:hypothetical protein
VRAAELSRRAAGCSWGSLVMQCWTEYSCVGWHCEANWSGFAGVAVLRGGIKLC